MPRKRESLKEHRELMQARRTVVSELLLKGYRRTKIAEMVKERFNLDTYSPSTLLNDMHAVVDELNEIRPNQTEQWLNIQLGRYTFLYKKALEQWEESGEKEYFASAIKALERIDKLLGLERLNVNVAADFKADITISHVVSGHVPASSEAEIRQLEGIAE
jgi:hypothetical protein